jgi:PKD domain
MKSSSLLMGLGVFAALLATGCGGDLPLSPELDEVGMLRAALTSASPHDVVAIRYKIVDAAGTCADAALTESISVLEVESLTPTIGPLGEGPDHRFADALFTLPPGDYRVCAFPLNSYGYPSVDCGVAEQVATVSGGVTNEIILVSQCGGGGSGALDAITVLNDPPTITDISITPSKFVSTCEDAVLTATASDPDGDDFSYSWSLVSGSASLTSVGNIATFNAANAGDYSVQLTVTDVFGGTATLVVPVHVAAGASCQNTQCHSLGYDMCPSGATEWCSDTPIDPTSSAQAQIACETCYGAPCFLEGGDCAGLGWGPNPPGSYVCGDAYFGFENGCSGDDGRTWGICNSFTTYGYWGKN